MSLALPRSSLLISVDAKCIDWSFLDKKHFAPTELSI
jgi:hypothetical protein